MLKIVDVVRTRIPCKRGRVPRRDCGGAGTCLALAAPNSVHKAACYSTPPTPVDDRAHVQPDKMSTPFRVVERETSLDVLIRSAARAAKRHEVAFMLANTQRSQVVRGAFVHVLGHRPDGSPHDSIRHLHFLGSSETRLLNLRGHPREQPQAER